MNVIQILLLIKYAESIGNARYFKFLQDQHRLVDDLFVNYSAKETPIYTLTDRGNGSDEIPKFTVNLVSGQLKLIEISDSEERATFVFDFTATWIDLRLSWNPDDYGGIDHLYLPISEVWVPEIAIVDCTEITTFMPDNMQNVWIISTGMVSFYQIEVVSVICEMDVFRFPMDEHTCSVNVIYYSYMNTEYQLNAAFGTMVRPVEEAGNGEWQMISITMGSEQVSGDSSTVSKFQATMKRNPGFYMVLVVIPAYIINVLSIIALFCNVENYTEKFQIGLTNIMSMSFIMVILAEDLPKTKRLPLLAIYVLVSLAIMLIAMGLVLYIPRMKKQFGFFVKSRRIEIEYIFMVIFQIANLINFLILFI